MDATTAVAQTLTCNVGDVTQAVDVSWKDSDGNAITDGQGGYIITKGPVDDNNVQKSTLTVSARTLGALSNTASPLTWKCAAKSTLYAESEISPYFDVVVTFLPYCTYLKSICLN